LVLLGEMLYYVRGMVAERIEKVDLPPCVPGSEQTPDDLHIFQVFHIILSGSLHDARQVNEEGMVDDVSEPFTPDIPLSNMPVSVYMTSEGRPGIVEVKEVEPFEADLLLKFRQSLFEALER
jgi:hypothetical protein